MHDIKQFNGEEEVAPFTGAWIETHIGLAYMSNRYVAPFTGAWIETEAIQRAVDYLAGRPLHGGVD